MENRNILIFTAIALLSLASISYASSLSIVSAKALPNCGKLNLNTSALNGTITSTCKWNGGFLGIYATSGLTGGVSVSITNANGVVYYSGSTISWCKTYLDSVKLPAQTYNVIFKTGQGGGGCGNAALSLSANAPSCKTFTISTKQDAASMSGLCSWTGGNLSIYVGAGNTGTAKYTLEGFSNHVLYGSNSTSQKCSTLIQTANLPAQKYIINFTTGFSTGSCGNAIIQLK